MRCAAHPYHTRGAPQMLGRLSAPNHTSIPLPVRRLTACFPVPPPAPAAAAARGRRLSGLAGQRCGRPAAGFSPGAVEKVPRVSRARSRTVGAGRRPRRAPAPSRGCSPACGMPPLRPARPAPAAAAARGRRLSSLAGQRCGQPAVGFSLGVVEQSRALFAHSHGQLEQATAPPQQQAPARVTAGPALPWSTPEWSSCRGDGRHPWRCPGSVLRGADLHTWPSGTPPCPFSA